VVNTHLICPFRPLRAIEDARSNVSLFPSPFVYFVFFVVTQSPFCESLRSSSSVSETIPNSRRNTGPGGDGRG
jgi:hypothetical protein